MNLLMQQDGMDVPGGKRRLDWPLLLTLMESISLGNMEGVRLMHRSDTKFVMSAELLPEVLDRVKEHYYTLEISGRRIATYETEYYDWPQGRFFLDHVNGKLNRHKVRIRTYVESGLRFLEVKKKTNTGKTIKLRMGLQKGTEGLDEEGFAFLRENLQGDVRQLQAVMVNRFRRITLVNREMTERVTIDVDLGYSDISLGKRVFLPGLVIVEVKQERFSASVMKRELKELRVKSRGISKYCLGISLLGLSGKTNNYKRKIRIIQKITHHGITA